MSAIDSTRFADMGLSLQSAADKKDKGSLGQADFLRLLTTQLQNQDPFKPMENGEFLGQMAQFSTVSGIQELQSSFSDLASSMASNQTLQAASLVGHSVMVPSDVGVLTPDGLFGAVDVPSSGQVIVDIVDRSGAIVRSMNLDLQPAGRVQFGWDGINDAGERVDDGLYGMQARVMQSGGSESSAANTSAVAQVGSVELSRDGLMLQLQGLGSASLAEVQQII